MLRHQMTEAQTPEELALVSSLQKIPDWKASTLSYQRINAGYTNYNFLVHVEEEQKTYFAKVVGANTETFINRRVAHEAALLAAKCKIAPAIVQYVEEDDFEVYEFLEGFRSCSMADMRDPDVSAKVMKAYALIHAGDPLFSSKTGFEEILEHVDQGREAKADTPPDLD